MTEQTELPSPDQNVSSDASLARSTSSGASTGLGNFQVGEHVAYFHYGYANGKVPQIKTIEAITPTGRIRIGKVYFKLFGEGYATQIGGSSFYNASLMRLTPELEKKAVHYKLAETMRATHWYGLPTETLKAVHGLVRKAQEAFQAKFTPPPYVD